MHSDCIICCDLDREPDSDVAQIQADDGRILTVLEEQKFEIDLLRYQVNAAEQCVQRLTDERNRLQDQVDSLQQQLFQMDYRSRPARND